MPFNVLKTKGPDDENRFRVLVEKFLLLGSDAMQGIIRGFDQCLFPLVFGSQEKLFFFFSFRWNL